MKSILLLLSLTFITTLKADEYYYQVEENDQLGTIFLSLGHKVLWPKEGQVNLFKKKLKSKRKPKLFKGSVLKIEAKDIVFKKNIILDGKYLKIITKAKTLDQYEKLLQEENLDTQEKMAIEMPPTVAVEPTTTEVKEENEKEETETDETDTIQSFNFYPGAGGFVARDSEKDRLTTSSTFTGLQPMAQLKGIYSNGLFGSMAIDLYAKKIINDKFSFPINTDYRVQFIPKWNLTDYFRFAISHSIIAHSYVGKNSDIEVPYKLNSNFIGFGIVIPRDMFWFELYIEKAYKGKTTSAEATLEADKGYRFDMEIVYPVSQNWRIIPGINYYQLKQNSSDYSLSVIELRSVFARSFEF